MFSLNVGEENLGFQESLKTLLIINLSMTAEALLMVGKVI